MYAVTSWPLVRRTRATFRRAELGFLGVTVKTLIQTPRLKGEGELTGLFLMVLKYKLRAGTFAFLPIFFLPFLTN